MNGIVYMYRSGPVIFQGGHVEKTRSGIVEGLLCILTYIVVGTLLGSVHTRLADGESIHNLLAAVLMPAAVAAGHITYRKWYEDWWQCQLQDGRVWGVICMGIVVYACLPVFMNVGSALIRELGHPKLGDALFEARYEILIWAPFALFLIKPARSWVRRI